MKELAEGFKKLNELVENETIDLNDFYCISMDRDRLALQGDFSTASFKKYEALFNIEFDNETKWFKGRKDGVKIVLTLG